jgi:hypothetical protein
MGQCNPIDPIFGQKNPNSKNPTNFSNQSSKFCYLFILLLFFLLCITQINADESSGTDSTPAITSPQSGFDPYRALIESSLSNGFDISDYDSPSNSNDDETDSHIDPSDPDTPNNPESDGELSNSEPPREYEVQNLNSPPQTFSTLQTTAASTLSIGMTTPNTCGATGTLKIVVTNFEYALAVGDYLSFTLSSDTFSFPLISYCTATFRQAQGITQKNGATLAVTTALAKGSTFTIQCTNTSAAPFQTAVGDLIPLTTRFTVTVKATNSNAIREYTSYTASSVLTAPGLGQGQLPSVTLTPENKMLFAFTTPNYKIPIGNNFMIALATAWYSNPQPTCTFHTMSSDTKVDIADDATQRTSASATATKETSDGIEMLILQVTVPVGLNPTTNYAFWCEGFSMPTVATTTRASGSIFDPTVNNFRAFSTSFAMPILRNEVAGTIFNVQLGSWTAGAITTMTASILRFPVKLTKGYQLSLSMPVQYQFQNENSAKCSLKQETKFQSSPTTISTAGVISGNIISFVLADDQEITNYYAITTIACDEILAMASHPALSNIKLHVFAPGATSSANPLYVRPDGALAQVYPAIIGSVNLKAVQDNPSVGGSGQLIVTASPDNISIQPGDYVELSPDQDYKFVTGVSSCALSLTNASTKITSSNGDYNIPITIESITANKTNTYIMKVTEASTAKKDLMKKVDSTIIISCDGVVNPQFEKIDNPTIDLAVYNPQFGINFPKGRCSGAVLPVITPSPMGLTQAYYQPLNTNINTVTNINIIINSLSNPIPKSADGGSIQFTLPSTWTPNASGSTTCSCNRPSCTGTTSISRGLDYLVTFRPANVLAVQDANGGSTIIFTCTNFRTPASPTNSLATLTITSFSSTYRIDMTNKGTIPEITQGGTAGSQDGTKVVHNLIFSKPAVFSQSELQILHTSYQMTFKSLGVQASAVKQQVQTAATFRIPPAFYDPTSNTGIISMNMGQSDEHFKVNTMGFFNIMQDEDGTPGSSLGGYFGSQIFDENVGQNGQNSQDDQNNQNNQNDQENGQFNGCMANFNNDDELLNYADLDDDITALFELDSGDENDCECTCSENDHEKSLKRSKQSDDGDANVIENNDGFVQIDADIDAIIFSCPCIERRRLKKLIRDKLAVRRDLSTAQKSEIKKVVQTAVESAVDVVLDNVVDIINNGDGNVDDLDILHTDEDVSIGAQVELNIEQNDQNDQNTPQDDINAEQNYTVDTLECPCKAKARALIQKRLEEQEILRQKLLKIEQSKNDGNNLEQKNLKTFTLHQNLQSSHEIREDNTLGCSACQRAAAARQKKQTKRTFSHEPTFIHDDDEILAVVDEHYDDDSTSSQNDDGNNHSHKNGQNGQNGQNNQNNQNDQNTNTSFDISSTTHPYNTMQLSTDVLEFNEDSTALIVSTLITLPDTSKSRDDLISAMNTDTSRTALSQQIKQFLSIQPYFKFTGISKDGEILPNHCMDGHWSEEDGETDVDCGGGDCDPCLTGKKCLKDSDCSSKNCHDKVCSSAFGLHGLSFIVIVGIICGVIF